MSARSDKADWSFSRRPFWLFSHVFAVTVIVTFVFLGLWQGNRHRERAAFNALVEERSTPPAVPVDEAFDLASSDELDYRYVTASGTFVEGDFVRVANRTQSGVAGDHVIAIFELADGRLVLINRGFVPLGTPTAELAPLPPGSTKVTGWLRDSADRGWIGATDVGEGAVVPRLDVGAIAQRIDDDTVGEPSAVVPSALQLEAEPGAEAAASGSSASGSPSLPDPIPLPPLDGGPHLSYMVQWFIFATLGALFYGALLRRTASGRHGRTPVPAFVDESAEPANAP